MSPVTCDRWALENSSAWVPPKLRCGRCLCSGTAFLSGQYKSPGWLAEVPVHLLRWSKLATCCSQRCNQSHIQVAFSVCLNCEHAKLHINLFSVVFHPRTSTICSDPRLSSSPIYITALDLLLCSCWVTIWVVHRYLAKFATTLQQIPTFQMSVFQPVKAGVERCQFAVVMMKNVLLLSTMLTGISERT